MGFRRFLRGLVLIGYVLAISLVMLEMALRAYPAAIPLGFLMHFEPSLRSSVARRLDLPVQSDMILVPRDDGGGDLWINRPNSQIFHNYRDRHAVKTARMDERGFCNPAGATIDGVRPDVVTVGDSLSSCSGVRAEDTFTARLMSLNGLTGYNVTAAPSGLYEYLQLIKLYALPDRPRAVVIVIGGGNDLRDAATYYTQRRNRLARDAAPETRRETGPGESSPWLFRNTYALNAAWGFLSEVVGSTYLRILGASRAATRYDFRYTLLSGTRSLPFNVENRDLDEVEYALMLRDGKVDLALFDEGLEKFKELADEHGFVPVIIFVPSAPSAYWPNVRFSDPELARVMIGFMENQAAYLAARSRELEIHFLDVTMALREAARENDLDPPLYFPINRHLTVQGHRVVADELARMFDAMDEFD